MLRDAGSGLHRWFVWSTTAVIGVAFLLGTEQDWLSDVLVGLVVVVGIHAAVHLISRSGTATGNHRRRRTAGIPQTGHEPRVWNAAALHTRHPRQRHEWQGRRR